MVVPLHCLQSHMLKTIYGPCPQNVLFWALSSSDYGSVFFQIAPPFFNAATPSTSSRKSMKYLARLGLVIITLSQATKLDQVGLVIRHPGNQEKRQQTVHWMLLVSVFITRCVVSSLLSVCSALCSSVPLSDSAGDKLSDCTQLINASGNFFHKCSCTPQNL